VNANPALKSMSGVLPIERLEERIKAKGKYLGCFLILETIQYKLMNPPICC